MNLLYKKNCYTKLGELVPSIPQNKKVTKMKILPDTINYVLDLRLAPCTTRDLHRNQDWVETKKPLITST